MSNALGRSPLHTPCVERGSPALPCGLPYPGVGMSSAMGGFPAMAAGRPGACLRKNDSINPLAPTLGGKKKGSWGTPPVPPAGDPLMHLSRTKRVAASAHLGHASFRTQSATGRTEGRSPSALLSSPPRVGVRGVDAISWPRECGRDRQKWAGVPGSILLQ
jgi:hypothetical protein